MEYVAFPMGQIWICCKYPEISPGTSARPSKGLEYPFIFWVIGPENSTSDLFFYTITWQPPHCDVISCVVERRHWVETFHVDRRCWDPAVKPKPAGDPLAQSSSYRGQILHQTLFAPNNLYIKQILHQTPSAPNNFYTSQRILYRTTFAQPTTSTQKNSFFTGDKFAFTKSQGDAERKFDQLLEVYKVDHLGYHKKKKQLDIKKS